MKFVATFPIGTGDCKNLPFVDSVFKVCANAVKAENITTFPYSENLHILKVVKANCAACRDFLRLWLLKASVDIIQGFIEILNVPYKYFVYSLIVKA